MKKITSLFLAIFCISILATGCGSATKVNKTDSQDNAQDNVYVNKDYSFQFTLPSKWVDNCKIVENANNEVTNAKFEVDFLYAPKNKEIQSEDMQTLLTIYVVTKDDWTEMDKNKEKEPLFGAYLGEKDDLVYLFSTPQSNPYGSETELGKTFDEMYTSFDIEKNFEILK